MTNLYIRYEIYLYKIYFSKNFSEIAMFHACNKKHRSNKWCIGNNIHLSIYMPKQTLKSALIVLIGANLNNGDISSIGPVLSIKFWILSNAWRLRNSFDKDSSQYGESVSHK